MLILIADDDRLIRFNMKSMLSDILVDEDYTFIEAQNGREMLELCLEKSPDIVFADIKMPYMSGLDVIEEAIKRTEDIEFVVISGYSDFQYAKRSIALGVNEYMVKPIDPVELETIMNGLRKKIQKHKKIDNSDFCMKILQGYGSYSVLGSSNVKLEPVTKEGLIGKAHAFMSFKDGKKGEKRLIESLNHLSSSILKNKGRYCLIHSVTGIPVVIEMHIKERDFLTEKDFERAVISSDSGSSMISFGYENLHSAFDMISKLDDEPYLFLLSTYPGFAELEELGSDKGKSLASLILAYIQALLESDEVLASSKAQDIMKLEMPSTDEWNAITRNLGFFLGFDLSNENLDEMSRILTASVREWIRKNGVKEIPDLPQRLTEYIDRHYMNDISISGLADHFGLTPNYVSTLFHQNTGIRFSEYLTDTRIAHARHLLVSNPNANVKDIALMTGYNSPRHFASIFQKIVGMTPSTYRKSRTGSDS